MAHFGNFDGYHQWLNGYHVGDHNTKPGRENAHPRQPREAEKTGKCSKDKDTFLGLLNLHSSTCRSLSLFLGLIRLFNLTYGVSNITQQALLVECAKVALPFCFPPSNIFQHTITAITAIRGWVWPQPGRSIAAQRRTLLVHWNGAVALSRHIQTLCTGGAHFRNVMKAVKAVYYLSAVFFSQGPVCAVI